jgi:hypothetical protein
MTMPNFDFTVLMVAKDMASKTIGKVSKQISGLNKAGLTARRGLNALGVSLAAVGAMAAVGIGSAVKSGIGLLAELETAVTSVDGAIKQMGLAGKVTGSQVATWAAEIEDSVGAAFDEKPITAGAAALIRYGKITAGNLRPAMVVMTDLAVKTGSVEAAARGLGKAMADPAKAAGALRRAGIVLTKSQQDQIKALAGVNDQAKAQAKLLEILAQTTTGAALNSQGPYARSMAQLEDASEHARMALAKGFLPVITRIADKLTTMMGDKKVMAGIEEFGAGLAGAFDKAVTFAEKVPWSTIGESLRIAGTGARALFEAFTSMPAWVQAAVISGWGLNKLTGGAVGSLVGQLAGGLVKGVLGIQAGVVNVTGGVVNGPGGALPGGGKTPGGGLLPALGTAGIIGATAAAIAAAAYVAFRVTDATLLNPKGGGEETIATNRNPNNVVNATWATIAENMRNGYRETTAAVDRVNYTVARKEWRPVINVSTGFTVSVRNVISAARVASTYNVSSGRRGTNLMYEGRNP